MRAGDCRDAIAARGPIAERRLFRADLRDVAGEDDRDGYDAGERSDPGDEPQRDREYADRRPGSAVLRVGVTRREERARPELLARECEDTVAAGGALTRVHPHHVGEQPDLVRVLAVERGRQEHDATRRGPVAQVERSAGDADDVKVQTRALRVADIH
jgi:hypothetical protein